MSIIEQTLDKLEQSTPAIAAPKAYHYTVYPPVNSYGKSIKLFLFLFIILLAVALFVIIQGEKLTSTVKSEKDEIPNASKIQILERNQVVKEVVTEKIDIIKLKKSKSIIPLATEPMVENTLALAEPIKTMDVNRENIDIVVSRLKSVNEKKILEEKILRKKATDRKAQELKNNLKLKTEVFVNNKKNKKTFLPDLSNLIPLQIGLGNYQNVLDILKNHEQRLANTWEYHYWRSQALIGMGELESAMRAIDIGLTKDSSKALLWIQRGLVFQEQGNHKSAIDEFQKADLMQQKPINLYLNLGYSAAFLGDVVLAKQAYNRYLLLTNNDPEQNFSIRQQILDYLKELN